MSAQHARNEIIGENLPKLIRQLTGFKFKDDDENMRRCEQFAWSIIHNHRNLSTNSHEVRRKIEGLQEKFNVDNCPTYAAHLGRLCDEIIEHPLCIEHYEVDVQWSLLDLLLTLAYNPTGALRRNRALIDRALQKREQQEDEPEAGTEKDVEYWKALLREDFIAPLPAAEGSHSDSDLSDWSDYDTTEAQKSSQSTSSNQPKSQEDTRRSRSTTAAPTTAEANSTELLLRPPEKESSFVRFNSNAAKLLLFNGVQHSWWKHSSSNSKAKSSKAQTFAPHPPSPVDSLRMEANFATIYGRFLSDTSNNFIQYEAPKMATEACLIRELLWLFHSPQKCHFFSINGAKIKVRDNVAVPSLTVTGLASFLEQHFLPSICQMHTLRQFLDAIYICEDYTPPSTLECYAANLRLLLEPIWQTMLDYEARLIEQRDFEINSLIDLHQQLRPTLKQLECIFELHQRVVLNMRQYPAHITSAYLLAALLHCQQVASSATEANMAMSLFLTSVKVFCVIIDTWWTEGRLDDWQQEFVVERTSNADQKRSICVRPYHKNKERAFFVPTHVSKLITEHAFFRLLLEHSLEAGCTLSLLYEINRIGDLRQACSATIEGKLYAVFVEAVLQYVRTLQSEVLPPKPPPQPSSEAQHGEKSIGSNDSGYANESVVDAGPAASTLSRVESRTQQQDHQLINSLSTTDVFLLRAFTANFETSDDEEEPTAAASKDERDASQPAPPCSGDQLNALSIFQQFQRSQQMCLPLEEVVLTTLTRILKSRIASANAFVMQLYRDEFCILKHLRNIRKVLLLESSDLMYQFYNKLFKQIESEVAWANPFLLTIQLDDIVCAKFPEMSSLFRLEINSTFRCQTNKVFEAVDELIVTYNFSRELAHIITERDIRAYNKVFRFQLKVKWGLMTLENLQFPRSHKRHIPYAPFQMIDLLMRRLEQLRFWMLYAIQSIHFHLMTHVLQSMGQQLDEKIGKCTNLKEMEMVHRSYVNTVCEHCFLVDSFDAIKVGVESLLNLTFILRQEWNSCTEFIESDSNGPLAVDITTDSVSEDRDNDYVANAQIDTIELTYIRCHQYLASNLNHAVYLKQKTFLSGLSAAFNTSLPY